MKERPILFSGPMVRALLDGSKTQTRRVMKPQLIYGTVAGLFNSWYLPLSEGGGTLYPNGKEKILGTCPYGQPGDRLWVREAFDFLPSGGLDQPQACEIVYWATGSIEPRSAPHDYNPMIYGHQKVRPSIHMPRWASRITLEITSVRVERLQDISEADAMAEGIVECPIPADDEGPRRIGYMVGPDDGKSGLSVTPIQAYRDLWESINGPDSWTTNPWVWVVEFKRLQK